jgi:hypothetical protein
VTEDASEMKFTPAEHRSRSVYLLQHIARTGSDDEDVKTLGIYSSKEKATLAVRHFKNLAGFKQYPNGFHIDRYRLNHPTWTEGFVTFSTAQKKRPGRWKPPR